MQKVSFEKDEIIFNEGEPSVHCYKILSGSVEILLPDPSAPDSDTLISVAVCGAGEIIGEMGVIEDAPRSATARALEKTVCISYEADEIISLLVDEPSEALAYVRTLIRRIRQTNNRVFFPHDRDT